MANLSAFYETRNMFIRFTGYTKPVSFEQWSLVPDDKKAAYLFVQFFDQITLAWDKVNAYAQGTYIDFIPSEDGVSITLQYLQKNVAIILDKPERFKPGYIYRVAYNCQYCIVHDPQPVKDRWQYERFAITGTGDDEVNAFDTITNVEDLEDEHARLTFEAKFWGAIEDAGLETEKVVRYLLSGDAKDLKRVNKKSKRYAEDPLRDVEVAIDQVGNILDDLRVRLASFQNI